MRLTTLDRRIIGLAVTALGTLAIEPLYILADTAIVGRLGTAPLAGLAIAATVLLTVTSLLMFLQYGVTPDVAFAHGAGDVEGARAAATGAAWVAVLLGVPAGAALAVFARPLCAVLGAGGDVLDAATTYLRISAVGLPFVLLTFVGHGVMRGLNDLRRPLLIVAVANVVNLVLEVIVVYGFDTGVAGSAASTVVAQAGAAVAFAVILRPHLSPSRPGRRDLAGVLAKGGHLGLRSLAMLVAWVGLTRVAATVDTPTLAAHQVVAQLFSFFALTLDALAIPAQSLVAGALGSGRREPAVAVGRSSIKLSLVASTVFAVVLVATSPVLPYVFTNDDAVASRVSAALIFLGIAQLPASVAFALDGVLIGGRDTRFLARAAMFNLLPSVPIVVLVLTTPGFGIAGLWLAELVYLSTRAIVNLHRFRSRRWMPALAEDLQHEPASGTVKR